MPAKDGKLGRKKTYPSQKKKKHQRWKPREHELSVGIIVILKVLERQASRLYFYLLLRVIIMKM